MAKRQKQDLIETKDMAESVKEALDIYWTAKEELVNGRHSPTTNEEFIDPRPMAVAVKFKRPPTIEEQFSQFLRSTELQKLAGSEEIETFDQSEDFDVDDTFARATPWEEGFYGQFEEQADEVRKEIDDVIAKAKQAKADREAAAELERFAAMDKRTRSPKGTKAGKPAASEPSEDED